MSEYIFLTDIFEYSNIRIYSSHSDMFLLQRQADLFLILASTNSHLSLPTTSLHLLTSLTSAHLLTSHLLNGSALALLFPRTLLSSRWNVRGLIHSWEIPNWIRRTRFPSWPCWLWLPCWRCCPPSPWLSGSGNPSGNLNLHWNLSQTSENRNFPYYNDQNTEQLASGYWWPHFSIDHQDTRFKGMAHLPFLIIGNYKNKF